MEEVSFLPAPERWGGFRLTEVEVALSKGGRIEKRKREGQVLAYVRPPGESRFLPPRMAKGEDPNQ